MKKIAVILLIASSCPVFAQTSAKGNIFNDTTRYFIVGNNSATADLTTEELMVAEQLLLKAFDQFNLNEQRYADSINPENKRRKYRGIEIHADSYLYRLVVGFNNAHEQIIWVAGNYRRTDRKGKNFIYNKDWKTKFIDPALVDDGGTGFIRVLINLSLKTYDRLFINGMG